MEYNHLLLILFICVDASILQFSIISLGINLTVIEISKGRIIKSSKYPKNGIKSGIKSIGEKAYTIIIPAKSFAIKGVS